MTLREKTTRAMRVGVLMLGTCAVVSASDSSVVGGGVVDGPLGLTSQLGFGATSVGGSFFQRSVGKSSMGGVSR